MAIIHPIPSSSFSSSSPLLLTATLCGAAAGLRVMDKINTLAASIIAVGAIVQYFFHRSSAKNALTSYANESLATYNSQIDNLVVKKNSLETALEESNRSQESALNERLALSESKRSKAEEDKKQLKRQVKDIEQFNKVLEMSFVVFKQETEQKLPDLNSKDENERKAAEKALESSWIELGNDLSQKMQEAEQKQIEMKTIERELHDLQQSQTQLKRKEQELKEHVNELIRLTDFDKIFQYIRQTDAFLEDVFKEIDSKFRKASCYEKITKFIQIEMEQKNDLSDAKINQLYKLSKFDTSTAPAADIVLNLVHCRANLVKLADYFNKLNQIKITNLKNSN